MPTLLTQAPSLSLDQRLDALDRANRIRVQRAQLKRELKSGQTTFDRILLDAPCSGTGTLARNPEIKWRLTSADLSDLHDRQVRLLAEARRALAPSGTLLYSTCSLEREENEDVIATVPPGLVERTMRRIPGIDPGDGFFAAVIKSDQPPND